MTTVRGPALGLGSRRLALRATPGAQGDRPGGKCFSQKQPQDTHLLGF